MQSDRTGTFTEKLFRLDGRVAVITGGAGLLGERHAEAIADLGGHPVLVDLPGPDLRDMAECLSAKYSKRILAVAADVTDPVEVENAVAKTLSESGRIDILINNAALTGKRVQRPELFEAFESYPLELWQQALDVNLNGTLLMTQSVGKVMRQNRSGVVINISSDVALISPDHRIYENLLEGASFNTPIAYSTTKAALLNFTRHLATYWAAQGIRVNALCPAGVYDNQHPDFVKRLANLIPMGRMATKDEYKGAIAFLSSEASSFMTGAVLVVDGGRTAW